MDELISMGFSNDVASEALTATGGNLQLATDWILNHNPNLRSSDDSPNNPSPSPSPSPIQQPKINRFFSFQTKHPKKDRENDPEDTESNSTAKKRQKQEHHQPLSEKPRPKQEHHQPLPEKPRPKQEHHQPLSEKLRPKQEHHQPLSERMRPRILEDIVGQDHLLSSNTLLKSAIQCSRLPSLILWGPPGCGKTTIAKAIVNSTKARSSYRFVSLSAVTCGVKDVRDAVDEAKKWKNKNCISSNSSKGTILFIDEVHRFNKAQQDSLLPVIEDGSVVFMGATTENPSFHLITPLLSRCRVLVLNPLKPENIVSLLRRAMCDVEKGLLSSVASGAVAGVEADDEALEFLSENTDGDARVALNALEVSATTAAARLGSRNGGNGDVELASAPTCQITLADVKEALQCKHIAYDRDGEEHYNQISALHKSMRGSDPDAAIYWLARMLEGGEQPLYIARRLIRFASEDVGLADPSALPQAVACYQACHFLGMPECDVMLAQCVSYLSLAPKSIAVYKALQAAQKAVKESVGQNERVPLHLRNASTKLMTDVGYGKGYIYPPENPDIAETQKYLPPSLQGYKFLDWPSSTKKE